MNVLVLSNTAGQGHNATGKAICDMLQSMGAHAEMIDTYEHINTILSEAISAGYLISTSRVPRVYGKAYRIAERKPKTSDHSPTHLVNRLMSSKLSDFVCDYAPDVIVCTHVFSAMVASMMKKRGKTSAKIISIITDFTIHPFWQEVDCGDWFVSPSHLLEYAASLRGMDPSKFLNTGIPIHPKFSNKLEKAEARRILGLDEKKNTVLLMSGSMGYGDFDEHIKRIDDLNVDMQVLVVCGSNKKMFSKLEQMRFKKENLLW